MTKRYRALVLNGALEGGEHPNVVTVYDMIHGDLEDTETSKLPLSSQDIEDYLLSEGYELNEVEVHFLDSTVTERVGWKFSRHSDKGAENSDE